MTKETEVLARLDRIIDLIKKMTDEESLAIKEELKNLHDWKIEVIAEKSTTNGFVEMLYWFGPWVLAIAFVLFDHKFKVL